MILKKLKERNKFLLILIFVLILLINISFEGTTDHSFLIFKSIYNIVYLIYSTKRTSIICYDLENFKIIFEIKNIYKRGITTFKHFSDKINKRDLIISISHEKKLNIWNLNNLECFL